ncbi:protein import receptor MAS20 [Rhodotorula sp. JG-1b]|nr:protein import receptor MAS20 [Rhodotorula sp. JG-1b]
MSTAPSSSSNLATALKVTGAVVGALAVATIGYAAVFDYRRRNDPAFRRKLLKQQKKAQKNVQHSEAVGKEQVANALKRALALVNAEKVPDSPEGKEQFFMEQVALGEQLAARSPEFYVASAISFYKALKVYPAPQELLMIYQKTQPAAVFDLVMELISLEINEATAAATASTTSGRPRAGAGAGSLPSDPLLEEVEPEKSRTTTASESESGSGAGGDENSSPSSGGSFVHVETDAVLTPKGEVEIEETIAVVADLEAEVEGQGAASATEDKADPPEPVLA